MTRCMIVDDEPIAIRVLSTHLEKVPNIEIAATCTNAIEALEAVHAGGIDLAFLDIEMPALSGIGFVESLAHPPRFIFTTAHRDYAVRGFELDAVDYLLKPVSFPRLLRAIEKYRRLELPAPTAAETDSSEPAPVIVQADRRTVRINPREVVFIESMGDYVIIHTETGKYTTKLRISDLERQLTPFGFVRIHRSYVAPLNRVHSFTSTEVQLGEVVLPVSRTYRQRVIEQLRDPSSTWSPPAPASRKTS